MPHECIPRETFQKLFDSTSRVITFNYTNVVELIYHFSAVDHIHGNINDEIVIGCDTFDRIEQTSILDDYPSGGTTGRPKDILTERMKYYDHDLKGNLVKKAPIERFYNEVLSRTKNNEDELVKLLKMRSKDSFPRRLEVISSLAREVYDEVHIIGHSLGKADWSVFREIRAEEIICYYHDDTDRARKQSAIDENGWKMYLLPESFIWGEPSI